VLGEPEDQLFVEAVEAADVGQDDDARARRLVGPGRECGEACPVGRRELELAMLDGGAGNDGDRRQ
jgi:hypothetical protein